MADLQSMFAAAKQRYLQTGLELLKLGQTSRKAAEEAEARKLLGGALPLCLESSKYYGNLLNNELNSQNVDLDRLRLQARHFSIAVLGGASCHGRRFSRLYAFGSRD